MAVGQVYLLGECLLRVESGHSREVDHMGNRASGFYLINHLAILAYHPEITR